MAIKKQKNIFYYSNNDTQVGSRIARELTSNLFISFSNNLASEKSLDFIGRTRLPNERELYGMFIKALAESDLKNELGYVATEFQVNRIDDAKGRVDIFFSYRKTSFLLELKVARIGLPKFSDEEQSEEERKDESPVSRIVNPWLKGVIPQLKCLNVEALKNCLHEKVIKMPMVVYLYVDWRKIDIRDGWQKTADRAHDYIIANLKSCAPDFEYFTVFEKPIRTRKRRTSIFDSKHDATLYGFSLVASAMGESE